jgi:hypothetical protein
MHALTQTPSALNAGASGQAARRPARRHLRVSPTRRPKDAQSRRCRSLASALPCRHCASRAVAADGLPMRGRRGRDGTALRQKEASASSHCDMLGRDETRASLLTIGVLLLRWLKPERAAAGRAGGPAIGDGPEPGDHDRNRVRFVSNSVRNADEHSASSLSRNGRMDISA